ncbi:MAG: hypothetical protein PHP17_01010 [Candidatus Omnitrophica bacterium]|nr:hypothetical protein [Candidatus Omnitrophota bacterium]
MSIIYEALKKAESNLKINPAAQNKSAQSADEESLYQPRKINPVFYALTLVCVVSTVFVALSAYFFNRGSHSEAVKSYLVKKELEKSNAVPKVTQAVTEAKVSADKNETIKPIATVSLPKSGEYSLQGIVYDDNSPFAVINGKTLRKSEAIDDFVVADIAPTSVILKNSKTDKELTLSF